MIIYLLEVLIFLILLTKRSIAFLQCTVAPVTVAGGIDGTDPEVLLAGVRIAPPESANCGFEYLRNPKAAALPAASAA